MTLPFYELEFGPDGQALSASQLDRLIAAGQQAKVTDLIFLAHGFRCDAADATALYAALLTSLRANLDRPEFAGRQAARKARIFAVAGVYWPSKQFSESVGSTESVHHLLAGLRDGCVTAESVTAIAHAKSLLGDLEFSRTAQDQFVASVLSALNDDGQDDPTEGLPLVHQCPGSDLLDKLRSKCGIESIPLISPILDAIETFLNFMSWSVMKSRSGAIGANGVANAVTCCQRECGSVRIHLIGHSLGGRLVAACSKTLGLQRAPRIDSLSLLEAAFSHFGFSPDAGSGQPGFFRGTIASRIVRGPIISTFSKNDAVVGTAYAVASRLTHDRLQAVGDSTDPYGGIGHNGAQRTPESATAALHHAGESYQFYPGIVTCLDGSAGLILNHGDVTNPHVTYAIASAICSAI